MAFGYTFSYLPLGDLFETLLPDFVLAFAFFTALIYAVLGRRLGQGRPSVAIAGALGMALAVGLVWWEESHGLSIRNLGSIAVGFAIIILAGVMYQAIKQAGGGWAGAAIALGATILIGSILGISWPFDARIVQTITTVTLTVGILAFLVHRHGALPQGIGNHAPDYADIRHDMTDLDQDRRAARSLGRGLKSLKSKAEHLWERPQDGSNVMLQLRRMLPAEGYLTERLARLREKAHRIRIGHIAQIEEVQKHLARLPPQARRQAASELAAVFKELRFDTRIERLDRAVAANEKRVRDLTQQAQALLQSGDHRGLVDVLKVASTLQKHNAHLLRTINRSEKRLLQAAEQAAKKAGGVKAS